MSSEVLKAVKADERKALYDAIRVIVRSSGGAMAFAFVSAVVAFAYGFYIGGIKALFWSGSTVLLFWWAGGAICYFLFRDVLLRVIRAVLTNRVSGQDI